MCSQFSQEESAISVKLVAVKTIIKYSRKVKDQELLHRQVSLILDDVIALLNRKDNFDYIYLPIEAIAMISKTNEQQISEVAPKVTPKLLLLFRDCQEFSSLSSDLLTLFKLWCNYQKCREMFIDQFLPFITGII